MLLSSSCAGCNQPGPVLCTRCRFALAAASSYVNDDGVRAVARFHGLPKQLIVALKYKNRRPLARLLALHLIRRLRPTDIDLVTWAPTGDRRIAHRGYDQAELLARAVARELGVPCRRLLYRTHGAAQTGQSRQQRIGAVGFRSRGVRAGLRVLVVDDVVTTGATMLAARSALLAAGVSDVQMVAIAAVPGAGTQRSIAPRNAPPHPHRSLHIASSWAESLPIGA